MRFMSEVRVRPRGSSQVVALAFISIGILSDVVPLLAQHPGSVQAPLAFKDVTVIDMTNGKQLLGQTVVIVGNRIQAVGPGGQVSTPPGAQVIDARGKYLIPGLWDMHVHVNGRWTDQYPRFLAHGVTGVGEMAQRFKGGADSFRVWQREIRAGTWVGPRMLGPSVDVSQGQDQPRIRIPEDARRVMDSLKAAGVTFLKYHERNGNPELFFAILREARRVGLPMVGHVPRKAGNIAAADSGLDVAHANENHDCRNNMQPDGTLAAEHEELCARMVKAYIRNGTWVTSTLIIDRWGLGEALHRDTTADEEARASTRRRFGSYTRDQAVAGTMHRFGFGKFLAGTDYPANAIPPGFSLLVELGLLVSSGLTPLEALQAATLNPVQSFDATDSLGTVAPGKLADLVLLDADPLADIRNVRKIRAVVANGRYFDRAGLDAMDTEGQKQVASYLADESAVDQVLDSIRARAIIAPPPPR